MDTITQGLLGAATAQLGFRQRIGPGATWAAVATAIVPDLDIFLAPLMQLTGSEMAEGAVSRIHRGLSHSLLMVPIIAAVVAGIWYLLRRRRQVDPAAAPFWMLYACCFVAALSHPLLDWCTSYGTQLLAPFTDRRFAIDAAPIIDLIYTATLILTLGACRIVRKLTRKPRRVTLTIGWIGFVLSVAYLGAGRVMHDRVVRRAVGMVPRTERVLRADAYPAIGTIFLWRTVVETPHRWHVRRVRPFGPVGDRSRTVPKVANEWTRQAADVPAAKTFRWFAMGRVRRTYLPLDGRHVVEFHDMRYGATLEDPDSLWSLQVVLGADKKVLEVSRRRHYRRDGFGKAVVRMWRDMWEP
ncbi:hypothetical protein LCGC14_2671620 [marine sediment metagenome]|uniref:Metal-dependent hydrolase n=1 Tax=marine sediment metagenome TaxID=412755 RepID=A0A0F9ABD5_9ZZZZ